MCGIFGLLESSSSGLFSTDTKIIWGMSLLTSMRGADATGFIGVDVKKNQTDIMKAVGGPWEWNNWKQSDEFMKRIVSKYNVVIGHGRAATIGKNVAQNAHPFKHGDITLVHNGTLRNFTSIKSRHKLEFDVDSEAVCYLINKIGLQETLDEIEGAFALAWWDAKNQTVNFIRNSERPLYYTISTNNKRLIFASESPTTAYGAFSHKVEKYKEVKEVPTWRHFAISCKGAYNSELEIVETNITKKYTSAPSHYTGKSSSHHVGFGGYGEDYWGGDYTPPAYSPNVPKGNSSSNSKVIVCTGEDLEFELLDYDELEAIQEGQKVIILRGRIPKNNAKIEVVSKYYKGPEALVSFLEKKETKPLFRGVVQEIRVLDLETFATRIFLDKAVEIDEKEETEEEKTHTLNGLLQLAQGKTISFHQWSYLKPKGCVQCGNPLYITKSNKMIRVSSITEGNKETDGIMCEVCSAVHLQLEGIANGQEKVALS